MITKKKIKDLKELIHLIEDVIERSFRHFYDTDENAIDGYTYALKYYNDNLSKYVPIKLMNEGVSVHAIMMRTYHVSSTMDDELRDYLKGNKLDAILLNLAVDYDNVNNRCIVHRKKMLDEILKHGYDELMAHFNQVKQLDL